jgi:glycosyltransferase involved in cell wall biosynthesis
MSKTLIVIVQDYVPEYRTSFFNMLNKELGSRNLNLEMVLDKHTVTMNRNGDAGITEIPTLIASSFRLKIGNRQIRFRVISKKELVADLVIVEQAAKNFSTWMILLIRKLLLKRTVLWGHGIDYVNQGGSLSRGLRRFMIHLANHVLVYTSGAKEALIRDGVDRSKITNVQNSTDTIELKKNLNQIKAKDVNKFIESEKLSKNLILFLGSLDQSKNLELLFEAAEIAHEIVPSLTLAVVGDGPLRKYVEEVAGRKEWIRFLGREERSKFLSLATAKAIVIPGRVGLVATDSLASEVPVVTVRNALHAPEFDYLREDKTCLTSENTPDDLGLKIVKAITKDFQITSSRESRIDVEKYSIQTMTANFVAGILKALGSKYV